MQEVILDWFKENAKTLIATLLAVLIVGGGVTWYRWNKSSKRQRAATLLREGVALFYAVRQTEQPDYSRSAASLERVIASYPSTPAAPQAELYLGHISFAQGDFAASLDHYRKAVDRLDADSPFLEIALLDIAYAQEAKGDYEDSISSLRRVLDLDKGVLKDRAVVGIGRCYEQQGKISEAIETYSILLKRFPNSPWSGELRSRLADLQSAKAKAKSS